MMNLHGCLVAVVSFLSAITPLAFSQLKPVFPLFDPAFVSVKSSLPPIERDTALERKIAETHIKTISRWKWGYGLPDKGEMVDSTFYDIKGRIAWTIISFNPFTLDPAQTSRNLEVFTYDSVDNLVQIEVYALPGQRIEQRGDLKQRITLTYNRYRQKLERISEAEQGRTEYAYNTNGFLEEETAFDRDGIYTRTFYIYSGGKLDEIRCYGRGEMKETPDEQITYTNDGDRQTEDIFEAGDLVEHHVVKTDKKGRIVERRGYDSHMPPAPFLNQTFSYDGKGDLISEIIQCESNPFAPDTRQVYSYNEKGFPVLRKRYSGKEVTDGTVYVYHYYMAGN